MSAASCCNEAFKLATGAAPYLDSYMMVKTPLQCSPSLSLSLSSTFTLHDCLRRLYPSSWAHSNHSVIPKQTSLIAFFAFFPLLSPSNPLFLLVAVRRQRLGLHVHFQAGETTGLFSLRRSNDGGRRRLGMDGRTVVRMAQGETGSVRFAFVSTGGGFFFFLWFFFFFFIAFILAFPFVPRPFFSSPLRNPSTLLNSKNPDPLPTLSLHSPPLPSLPPFPFHSLLSLLTSQLKKPSLSTTKGPLYFAAPPSLESATRPNLGRFMRDVVGEGDEIEVTDQALPSPFKLKIRFGDEGGSGGGGE